MNRTELYYKTIDTLLDAYNSGKLEHGKCSACAVGNICGGKEWNFIIGYTNISDGPIEHVTVGEYMDEDDLRIYKAIGNDLIKSSGYTAEELSVIEFSFEIAIADKYWHYRKVETKTGQYLGLVAVLKVLARIHEVDKVEEDKSEERLERVYQDKMVAA